MCGESGTREIRYCSCVRQGANDAMGEAVIGLVGGLAAVLLGGLIALASGEWRDRKTQATARCQRQLDYRKHCIRDLANAVTMLYQVMRSSVARSEGLMWQTGTWDVPGVSVANNPALHADYVAATSATVFAAAMLGDQSITDRVKAYRDCFEEVLGSDRNELRQTTFDKVTRAFEATMAELSDLAWKSVAA